MELLACAPKWQSNGVILAGPVESPDPNLAGAPSLPANKKTGRGPQPVLIRASPRCNRLQISFGTITTFHNRLRHLLARNQTSAFSDFRIGFPSTEPPILSP